MAATRIPPEVAFQIALQLHPDIRAAAAEIAKEAAETKKYKDLLKLEKLSQHATFFQEYCKKNGHQRPINTTYSLIDSYGNWLISRIPLSQNFVRTNQPFAKQAMDAIAKAEQDTKKREWQESENVLTALYTLRIIHKQMTAEEAEGSVKNELESIINEYELPLEEKSFEETWVRMGRRV